MTMKSHRCQYRCVLPFGVLHAHKSVKELERLGSTHNFPATPCNNKCSPHSFRICVLESIRLCHRHRFCFASALLCGLTILYGGSPMLQL